MKSIGSAIRRHPVLTYFVLAYILAWSLAPLMRIAVIYAAPALLVPAAAAMLVSSIEGGRPALTQLLRKVVLWRVGALWYLAALGIPVLLTLVVALLARAFHPSPGFALAPVDALSAAVFVLVVGEELGWRGFAQPRLEASRSAPRAALVVGLLWGLWHLPNFFVTELPHSQIPLPAFLIWTVALSVIAAWLLRHTRGSVLIATLLHGSANTFGFLTPNLDTGTRWWLIAGVYAAAAVVIAALAFRAAPHPADQ